MRWKSSKRRSLVKWKVIQYKVQQSEIKWSEVNEAKWSGMRWSEVQYWEGGERVFMEKVYRSSKWWEVKDWGESVSELVIGEKRNNNKKLYTVLSYWGVFTFCTCYIVIYLVCFVASFKLSCMQLLLVGRVYCCSYLMCICCTVCVLLFFYFRCRTAG